MADIDGKVELCEASSLSESKEIISNDTVVASDNPEIDGVGGNISQISVISASSISDEDAFESAIVSKSESNLIFQGEAQLSKKMFVKDKSSDTYPVANGEDTNGNESSEPSTTRLSEDDVNKLDSVAALFDLNEDINEAGMGEFIQPVVGAVSSYSVIKVVAKAGIPRGLPTTPLKFEGGLNWKGSAELSAFRSVALSHGFEREPCSKNGYSPRGFTGIDLNVAAVEEHSSTLQEYFCSGGGSKRAKLLSIDLNFLHDNANGLCLNAYTCNGETSKKYHWLGQDHESLGNKTSDHSTNLGKREIDFISRASLTDSSTMQQEQAADHSRSKRYLAAPENILEPMELLQRVAPWHPKSPYISCTLPPQNHFSQVPCYQNDVPYSCHPQEHGNLVQIINRPTVDAKVERSLPTTGIRMGETKPFMFLTGNQTDEHLYLNQETWYATSMKRKEPEGGIKYYQLGYRQDI